MRSAFSAISGAESSVFSISARAAAKAKGGASAGDSVATRAMRAAYRPVLAVCLRFPKTLCLIMAALFAGSVYLASGFGASFIQSFHEDAFTVFVSTPPGKDFPVYFPLASVSISTPNTCDGSIS